MSVLPQPGVTLIKTFEGCHLEAYPDPLTGAEPYTIGWGSTRRKDGSAFFPGEQITQQEADELLSWQLQRDFLPALAKLPGWASFNPYQAGALLSFAYNLGAGFYGAPGFQTITRVLQTADWAQLEYALTLYRNPGSVVEEGLLRRRLTEAQTFLQGTDGVNLSAAGRAYLADTQRTYQQSPQLSDQALRYLAAIAATPASQPMPSDPLLQLTDPPLTGEAVRRMQVALVQAGAQLSVDGIFGPATQAAVEQFQRQAGLRVDGIVGPQTHRILQARTLQLTVPNLRGEDVTWLQKALGQSGLSVFVDGTFGPQTEWAVKQFQTRNYLLPDGIVGPKTWVKLGL